jgi:hypothetical protein
VNRRGGATWNEAAGVRDVNESDGELAALHRAEDFITIFNEIERELKRRTDVDNRDGFRTAAYRFRDENPWWRSDQEAMLGFADLRNVINYHATYKIVRPHSRWRSAR